VEAGDLPWDQAVAALRSASSVLVVCHTDPDGDAVGSLAAMVRGLRSVGLTTHGLVPGGKVPRPYAFLVADPDSDPDCDSHGDSGAEQDPLLADGARGADVLVTVDCSTPERLAEYRDLIDQAGVVVVLDHHTSSRPFGDIRLVDPTAAATTVLVDRLLSLLAVPLGAPLATALYTGLMTDTGSFRYERTTAQTHRLAARLIDAGASPTAVAEAVFEGVPYGALRLSGRVLGRSVLERVTPDAGLIWSSVGSDEIVEYGVERSDLAGLVGVMRSAAEAEVAMFLMEDDTGQWRTSLRSAGRVDVGALAAGLGGGGHPRAAGFTSSQSLVKTVGTVRRAVRDTLSGAQR
jgi:phosphoesterase RecJ-like protein